MGRRRRKSRHHEMILKKGASSIFKDLWDAFWYPPAEKCPKCGHDIVEYYDPFFFNPVRTLRGKRRVKCMVCHFIWRPKRSTASVWDKIMPRH